MTCDEIEALKGNTYLDQITPSLLWSMFKHFETCPACKKKLNEHAAQRSPEEKAITQAAAAIYAPAVLAHALFDKESK